MSADHNIEVMRRLAELWQRGEYAAIGELLHEDVEMVTTPEWPLQGPYQGRAEFLDALDQWLSAWERMDLQILELRPFGQRLGAHGRWVSRGHASGAENALDFGVLVGFADGVISRLEFFREPADAFRLGAA